MLAGLFDNWEQHILRPVLVTVLTTCVLLVGSLAFRPIRAFLFPPEEIPDYPLYCTAEPYTRHSEFGPALGVDFFVINRTGEEQTQAGLEAFLKEHNPDASRKLTSVLRLTWDRSDGEIREVFVDEGFNDDKGEIAAVRRHRNVVQITPTFIRPRAIMKITIVVKLPFVGDVTRAARTQVHFAELEKYQRACYDR